MVELFLDAAPTTNNPLALFLVRLVVGMVKFLCVHVHGLEHDLDSGCLLELVNGDRLSA